ncbi:MAG TPA: PDZ domain-containing protein, partial [Candidatus Saccharimonadia bacterium]|nr:PDZ domain-containing protein [Candidatus Saccharimonadia bacterium]
MKLKPLNRLLLCACLLFPCLAPGPNLRAQDQEQAAPEKKEKEQKQEKEYKTEKRLETQVRDNLELAAKLKLRDKVLFTKTQKPGVKIPFLGVVLGPVDESLGSQLDLPDGIGVLVRAVLNDSPAAKAGVMQHDVLHYFNDQLLVNEQQLQTLVQQAGTGSEVKLTLFRKGKSEVMTVKLGETLAQEEPVFEREKMLNMYQASGHGAMGHPNDFRWAVTAYPENYDHELREFQERMQKLQGNSEEMRREIERFTDRMKDVAKIETAKRKQGVLFYRDNDGSDPKVRVQVLTDGEDGKGAVATAISSATGKDGTTIVTHNNTTRAKWKNEQGSGELSVENGRKQLTVKDAEGNEIYSGPLDTKEQRMKLPLEVREQLERIEQGLKFEVRPALTPEPAKKQPEDS